MGKMKAITLVKPKVFVEELREMPKIKEDEVLVNVKAVGICGSDVHYYEKGRIGRYVVEKPLILGHETSGQVVLVGSKVKNFKIGDRVAIEPGATCGKCEFCKSGRYNLCEDVKFFATPPVDGAFCEFVAVREDYLFKIPKEMPYDVATLVEPLSVGVHASKRSNVSVSDTVLILGLGPVGLLAILASRAFGASKVIAIDVEDIRLNAAKKLGADYVINGRDENLKEKIYDLTDGKGPDVSFETAGSKQTTKLAFNITKRGGRVVLIGLTPDDFVEINTNEIVDKEYNVYGIFRYANTYSKALEILSKNQDKAKELITHKFSFDKIPEAFEFVIQNRKNSIKTVIEFSN